MVKSIERIKTKFEFLALGPWNFDRLPKPHVHRRETRSASCIPGPSSTCERKINGGNGRGLAGEILQGSARIRMDSGFQTCRIDQDGGSIQREGGWERASMDGERIAGSPSDDAGGAPTTHDGVGPSGSIVQEMPALANGKIIDIVHVDGVARVKIRT